MKVALNVLIVKNAVAIVVIGSLVLFASIVALISPRSPPPQPIVYIQILQTAGVILAVSGALVFVLEIRKSHLRLKKSETSKGTP